MRPDPGEVLHFSEDPTIERFVPHVAPTSRVAEPYVWAVGPDRCPDYWFPRACPRAMAWTGPRTTAEDAARIVGAGCGERVHAIEYGWLKPMLGAELYAYRFAAAAFTPIGDPPHAMVSTTPVTPLGPPERVGDLVELHERAGIQVRLLDSLWPFWDEVIASSLEFSGIRMRNARR
ncbi:hypothetical protein OUY22_09475 [Nonomuraea sp. MCN248]|uniref:Uncharacterized protein n=1 Tax=Nonomuraea corallina TaxID=2989783 RepID=A0ABT4S901_9ACTN|nr:DUF6886 family protein [Nonomuraea corallina]MDA0633647.1 hypothetical protein [Nonomuraea corallina]